MFMLIIWLQGIWLPLHGYDFAQTPLWAGIYMLPLTLGFLIAGPISGILSDRYGARPFATAGMLLASIYSAQASVGGLVSLKSFVVVILGGMGSFPGAIAGGLLLGVAGIFTWRRQRSLALACLLITSSAVAVLLGADLYEFSWRYQLPAIVSLPIAGALGATALVRVWQERRRRVLVRSVSGSDPVALTQVP